MILTRPQRMSIWKLYCRLNAPLYSYLVFRRTVKDCGEYIMIQWCGMWVGIEKNGYTHT